MSWSELERLVEQAEANPSLRPSLKGCRSTPELILAARRLGYRITRIDLQRAWEEERREYKRQAQGLRKASLRRAEEGSITPLSSHGEMAASHCQAFMHARCRPTPRLHQAKRRETELREERH